MGNGGGDVDHALVHVETLHQSECLAPIFLGLVGKLNAGLQPPEQVRGEREAAARRVVVADLAHHVIDAEDFLDHHHAGSVTRRRTREIGPEAAVRAFDADILTAHLLFPSPYPTTAAAP
jgi:hypothetical protein